MTFVHGVQINDKTYAQTATKLLKEAFSHHAGIDADEALVIRPTFWAPILQQREDELFRRSFGASSQQFFTWLTTLSTRVNAGSAWALVPLGVTTLLPRVPWVPGLAYPTLRWLVTQFLGDAVAYQIIERDRAVYDGIHGELAATVRDLADDAGDDAPLCVIGHSLGTVIASNYFYDLQVKQTQPDTTLVGQLVRDRMKDTPLERGDTLAFLYTLGSPLALWALGRQDFGMPLTVPSPRLRDHHPVLEAEWVNFYDPDDLVSYPLRGLSCEYSRQVREDRKVSVGPWWASLTPLAHFWYWNDRRVIDRIARALAKAWKDLV